MFLYDLTDRQKEAFLIVGIQFIHIDGVVTIDEKKLFELMRREASVEIPPGAREFNRLELIEAFDTDESKIILLLELLHLGYIDGEFSPPEHEFLLEFADKLGFTEDQLTTYAHWVLGNIAWQQQAVKFWENGSQDQ